MRLIVGLGTPGREYADTRHNVGFMVVDAVASRRAAAFALAPAQVPETLVAKVFDEPRFLLAKPLTFMNRSGEVVAALARYYDIVPEDILIVVDEVDLPFGRLRARARGTAGTHNGLRSIVDHLGTTEFPRLRLGVGRGDARRALADHVLSTFEAPERAALDEFMARAADAAEMFAAEGIVTTDLYPKIRRADIGGGSIVGIAKGAGMIEPNLATMLVYIFTDQIGRAHV